MAQFIFHVLAKFGKRLLKSIRHKQRVVAESVFPARREPIRPSQAPSKI